jgi:hypothetical protein
MYEWIRHANMQSEIQGKCKITNNTMSELCGSFANVNANYRGAAVL